MSTVKSKKLQVGTDATSSNNFTIYQPATPDGTLRIGVGNADSPTEVGQFNSNGYKPVLTNIPNFKATLSSNQLISNGTWTKIQFSNEAWDTTGDYDSTTNYRFTPSVAGYYFISCAGFASTNTSTRPIVSVYKNGQESLGISSGGVGTSSNGGANQIASGFLYMNGTTDYLEGYYNHNFGSSVNLLNYGWITFFQAILIQQA